MNITQCRMARAGLRWSLDDLANASGIGRRTIAKFEAGGNVLPETVEAMRAAMVAEGVAFSEDARRVSVACLRER